MGRSDGSKCAGCIPELVDLKDGEIAEGDGNLFPEHSHDPQSTLSQRDVREAAVLIRL